jgi:hypothetical protein
MEMQQLIFLRANNTGSESSLFPAYGFWWFAVILLVFSLYFFFAGAFGLLEWI